MKRLEWRCRENAAGALYKIMTREKLVNVSQNCGRIEMSSAGVWMQHKFYWISHRSTVAQLNCTVTRSGNNLVMVYIITFCRYTIYIMCKVS